MNSTLNSQQQLIKDLVLKKKSICITGSAGTGKSFLLRELITILQTKYGKKKVGITSTTGTGATVIGGTTLASFLGLKNDSHLDKEVIFNRIISSSSDHVLTNWKKTQVLIIDEISMLDNETFDKLENLARDFRLNNFPFGKIQLILVGDFCQLPPVSNNAGYCFEAQSWNKCIFQTINLTQIYRQKDDWFISYLENIRLGNLSQKRWENLLSWKQKEPKWPQDGIKPVNLFATKKEANGINEQELTKLEGESRFFVAEKQEWKKGKLEELIKSCLAVGNLELKIGTQVMLIFNWHEMKLVNGSQGVVVGFASHGRYWPIVKFTDGRELVIKKHCWEKIEGYYENGKPYIVAKYSQIPLILSWAMTIHKSQGQTIERLRVDLSKCFMSGQIYTALSRCSNPQYLQIINFPRNRLWCSKKVRDYYKELDNSEIIPTKLPYKSKYLNNLWITE